MAKATAELLIKVKKEGEEALNSISTKLGGIVKAGALVASSVAAAATAMGALASKAADMKELEKAFSSLANSQGKSADQILAKMSEVSEGLLTRADMMKAANEAIMLGLPIDRMDEMARIARAASDATGQSMSEMLTNIVAGLGKGSERMLTSLGIVIDTESAYAKYAITLGKTSKELTEAEKKQAFLNEALKVGGEKAAVIGTEGLGAADKWDVFKNKISELATDIGVILLPAFERLLDVSNGWLSSIISFTPEASRVLEAFGTNTVAIFASAAAQIGAVFDGIAAAVDALKPTKSFGEAISQWKTAKDAVVNGFKDAAAKRVAIEDEAVKQIGEINKASGTKSLDDAVAIEQGKLDTKQKHIEAAAEAERIAQEKLSEHLKKLSEENAKKELEYEREILSTREDLSRESRERDNAKALEDHKKQAEQFNATLDSGFQGLAGNLVTTFAESVFPGFGAAAGKAFQLLAMDSEKFTQTLNQLFSTEFINNMIKNLTILFEKAPDLIVKAFLMIADKIDVIIQALVEAIIRNLPQIIDALLKVFLSPQFYVDVAKGIVLGLRDGLIGLGEDFANGIKYQIDRFLDKIGVGGGGGNSGGYIGQQYGKAKDWIGKVFSDGGPVYAASGMMIPYAPRGTDTVPAMLTPGEFVVNRDATQRNLTLLQEINAGGSGRSGTTVNITVYGGLLGDDAQARQFAKLVDERLFELRQGNESRAFDSSRT